MLISLPFIFCVAKAVQIELFISGTLFGLKRGSRTSEKDTTPYNIYSLYAIFISRKGAIGVDQKEFVKVCWPSRPRISCKAEHIRLQANDSIPKGLLIRP